MLIEVIDVSVETKQSKNTSYKMVTVTYRDGGSGKVQEKKLTSFGKNKKASEVLSRSAKGDKFEVTLEKDGDYWAWSDIKKSDEAMTTETPSYTKAASPSPRSNYETPEERAARQVYIIRQSSLSSAIAYYDACSSLNEDPSVQNIIDTAKVFESYVLTDPFKVEQKHPLETLEDDIPY